MVIGLNYRTAPVDVRERFWISSSRRSEALQRLSDAEGIEEVVVMATCNRTEFWLWTDDVTLAANSVMRLLGAEYGLKLCEWKHFYRLLDEAALLQIFRVAASLDSMVVGEPQVVDQVKDAWQQAKILGTTGRSLDAVLQKALTVSNRVRSETAIGDAAVSIPYAAVELAQQTFPSLDHKKVVLLGAGEMSELAARGLLDHGARSIRVVNRSLEHAAKLAEKLGGVAVPFENRRQAMADADIIISSTSSPRTILSRDEAEDMLRERKNRPLVIVDISMPRNIDARVRELKGVFLYDLDDLENVSSDNAAEREAAIAQGQKILQAEAHGFRCQMRTEPTVTAPTIVALRSRLDELCRQELDSFRKESGPFSRDQDEMLNSVMSRMTHRIAGSLARELKELPEKVQQEQMATALQRLFHLRPAEKAIAGTKLA